MYHYSGSCLDKCLSIFHFLFYYLSPVTCSSLRASYVCVFIFRNVIQNHMQLCTSWLPSLFTLKGHSQPPWAQVAMPQMNSISPKLAFDALRESNEPETISYSYSKLPTTLPGSARDKNHFREHYHRCPSLCFLYQEPKFCVHRQNLPCLCHWYPFGPWLQIPHHLLLLILQLPLHVIAIVSYF